MFKWILPVVVAGGAVQAIAYDCDNQFQLLTGYRSDQAYFSLCSTLSDPDYYGYGKLEFRNVNFWQLELRGRGFFGHHLYLRGSAAISLVLGGRSRDSGVLDILSDPYNATLGQNYYSLFDNCGCDQPCPPCQGGCCDDKKFRNNVASNGWLSGYAWDAAAALGYLFYLSPEMGIAPVIGASFHQQRYKIVDSAFGPLPLQYFVVSPEDDFYLNNVALYSGAPENNSGTSEWVYENGAADPIIWSSLLEPGCRTVAASFGGCGSYSAYRPRWMGGFIGLDLLWAPSQNFTVTLEYELHLRHLSGRFDALGGSSCCGTECDPLAGCELCPQLRLSPFGAECKRFCPATISWDKWGWGQLFYFAFDYRCNSNWRVGAQIAYSLARAGGCSAIDPCASCCEVVNGAAVIGASDVANPIWSEATFQQARWRSISAQASIGYSF